MWVYILFYIHPMADAKHYFNGQDSAVYFLKKTELLFGVDYVLLLQGNS